MHNIGTAKVIARALKIIYDMRHIMPYRKVLRRVYLIGYNNIIIDAGIRYNMLVLLVSELSHGYTRVRLYGTHTHI